MDNMSHNLIYLDNNATTPCAPEVLEVMLPFYREIFGNAASSHILGRRAANAVARAREQVATTIGCLEQEVVFTSGATESNNLVLLGITQLSEKRPKIITSAVEHKSVLAPCHWLREHGFEIVELPVDANGRVDMEVTRREIDAKTLLVSIQGANNEIGTIQPIQEIADFAHRHGALVHADMAQMLGKLPIDVTDLGIDYASFSAHKVYGPKGVGVLFVGSGQAAARILPLLHGGSQESGYRPGTLNVPGIVGFGEACRLTRYHLTNDMLAVAALRDELEERLLNEIPGIVINARTAHRLPGTTSIIFPGISGDILLANLKTICVGYGSACNSGAVSPSHVLTAMGLTRQSARETVRISFGRYNISMDVKLISSEIRRVLGEIRELIDS